LAPAMETVEELPPAGSNRLTSGGLHLQGKPAAECRRLVEESLEAVGLKERAPIVIEAEERWAETWRTIS
jgi:hypothetical protein